VAAVAAEAAYAAKSEALLEAALFLCGLSFSNIALAAFAAAFLSALTAYSES